MLLLQLALVLLLLLLGLTDYLEPCPFSLLVLFVQSPKVLPEPLDHVVFLFELLQQLLVLVFFIRVELVVLCASPQQLFTVRHTA